MVPRGTISKVRGYYITKSEYADEISRACKEFFGEPDSPENDNPLFNEWLSYDFRFSDRKSMFEKYYIENPHNLPDYRREIYKTLLENYYGLFEVLEVKRYIGLSLKRLSDGKIFDVSEVSATMDLDKGDVFVTRVAKVVDHYELVGCDTQIMKLSQSKDEENKKFYLKKVFPKVEMKTPKDAIEFFRKYL